MKRSSIHSSALSRKLPFRLLCAYRWRIGIRKRRRPVGSEINLAELTFVDAPVGHYYADPFIFEEQGRVFLFFEDYSMFTRLGTLVCAELDRSLKIVRLKQILNRPYHLSYPHVFWFDGSYFMIPETASAECVELYRAVNFPWDWRFERVLLSGAKYQDVTVLQYAGRHWLLAGGSSTQMVGDYDELHIFHGDSILGTFTPHPGNPVRTDLSSARPAGAVIKEGDRLIRPAQDCSLWYGCGLNFMEIEVINELEYRERQLLKLAGSTWTGNIGIHTYNASEHLEAFDFCSYGIDVPAIIGRAKSFISHGVAKSPGQAQVQKLSLAE